MEEQETQTNMEGMWYPKAVNGVGSEARYQNGDAIRMAPALNQRAGDIRSEEEYWKEGPTRGRDVVIGTVQSRALV
jgi:hypothetical protein